LQSGVGERREGGGQQEAESREGKRVVDSVGEDRGAGLFATDEGSG